MRLPMTVRIGNAGRALVSRVAPVAREASPSREIEIVVDEAGFSPACIPVSPGERVQLKFVRNQWNGCTRDVLIPRLGVHRDLPTYKPVVVRLPPLGAGVYEFSCAMACIQGAIVVSDRQT